MRGLTKSLILSEKIIMKIFILAYAMALCCLQPASEVLAVAGPAADLRTHKSRHEYRADTLDPKKQDVRLPQWPGRGEASDPPTDSLPGGSNEAGFQPADRLRYGIHESDSLPLLFFPFDSLPGLLYRLDRLYLDSAEYLHPLEWEQVEQDALIHLLLHAHREAVSRQQGIPGYRVHLYIDSGNRARMNTQREREEFSEKYPDTPVYIVYEEPYFKLRAGDFRTRLDARRFLEKVRRDYPAAYIVVDRIEFPSLD